MAISCTFRHMEPSPELRLYVEEKIDKLKKYFDSPVDAHIVLKVEKFRHTADMTLSSDGNTMKAVEQTGDMYSSVDQVMDKIEEQLRRLMSRKKEFKPEHSKGDVFEESEIEAQESLVESGPRIIKAERVDIKPMDINEAAMQIELSNQNFLVFTNAKSKQINIIYKRRDGNLGLIDTSRK
ncbi:MAG: ribosome-associated translation inhibitor RaiA [Deltaproteobacteria bacterium]|nr:MAG: ribosome-associated translation inhibitor RaiA [Deltaproteobacteria bacterium]